MTGKPRRERAKTTMQALVSHEAYRAVQPLLLTCNSQIKSFSSLFETIVFLSEHMYIAEPNNGFISELVQLKAQRSIDQLKAPGKQDWKRIHVTIDNDAYNFIGMLKTRYGMVFSSRSEIADLLLQNIGRNCITPSDLEYYCRRLNEVLYLHPVRSS